jgi:hypothetical protein
MNPLTSLITTLQTELGLGTGVVTPDAALSVQALQEVIMEGAIATFLSTEDVATTSSFIEWVETHQADANLLNEVFEKFPTLLTAVHTEMVEAIKSTQAAVVAE